MARTDTLPHFLTDVANAIRTKTGSQETIQASSFDTAISNISGGGGVELPSDIWLKFEGSETTDDFSFLSNMDFSNVTNFDSMFNGCLALTTIPLIDTSSATNTYGMFSNCESLISVPALDTSNVTDMASMFEGCTALETVPQFDTSSVTNMDYMFINCSSLSETSLNNILGMCASVDAENYEGSSMSLTSIGIDLGTYDTSTIEGLNNYQDFINAGWVIDGGE